MTVVLADRFPVKLLGPDGDVTHPKAKVILTGPEGDAPGRLMAWSAPDLLVYDVAWDRSASKVGSKASDWLLETDVGVIGVRSAGGCGCGDALKHFVPLNLGPYQMGRL